MREVSRIASDRAYAKLEQDSDKFLTHPVAVWPSVVPMHSPLLLHSQFRGIKAGLLSILVLCAGPMLFGQLIQIPPLISTTGTALVRVVPDLADLSFVIEVRNVDLTKARKEEGERAKKVLAALRAAGVAETELQSSQVQISPNYTERRQETEQVKFYVVSQSISCTLHELKKVSDVTAEAVAAGVTSVGDVSLRTSQLRKYRDEARSKAIHAAREKAVALAGELGSKVGKPHSIQESQDFGYRALLSNNSGNNVQVAAQGAADDDQAGDGTTFAPGTISIVASISVSFLLE